MATPTWPPALNHYCDRGAWKFDPGDPTARTDMDAGPQRIRNRFSRSVPTLSARISFEAWEFDVFKAFWRIDLNNGASWFTMPVYEGGSYVEREVRLLGTWDAAEAGYLRSSVPVTLEIRSFETIDQGSAYLIGQLSIDTADLLITNLHEVVNVDLPAATGGL